MPGQQRGRTVDARVAEPRLGRADQSPRHHRPVVPGEKADDVRRLVATRRARYTGHRPGQSQRGRRQFARGGLVVERGDGLAGFHLSGGHQLRHGKDADVPRFFRRVDIGDGRVRRAQVETDDITARCACGGHGVGQGECLGQEIQINQSYQCHRENAGGGVIRQNEIRNTKHEIRHPQARTPIQSRNSKAGNLPRMEHRPGVPGAPKHGNASVFNLCSIRGKTVLNFLL